MADKQDTSVVAAQAAASGVSPYATGGGGVTLERRAAVIYLARLLTGGTSTELHGRRVERVAFQQAPASRVDDLVISAATDDGTDPLELDIAVRRTPQFTTSDGDTEKLLGGLLAELDTIHLGSVERLLAICVAGPQPAAQQVSQLAALARQQATASGFFALLGMPGRFRGALRDRLEHLVKLVTANLVAVPGTVASREAAEVATWQLLDRLEILMPRLETPDEADWSQLLNQLEPWAREPTVLAATSLRDRLEALAARYAPAAAVVDLATLRRDAHEVLHVERRRRQAAWAELRRLDEDARTAVRATFGVGPAAEPLHLPRPAAASEIRGELHPGDAVLVSGESGVGKSALVLGELAAAAAADSANYAVVYLNLRLLPSTMVAVREALGAPLEELLAEVSAPTRVLVLDAADVTIERDDHLLAQLLRAASAADVTPWVLSATDGHAAVQAVMQSTVGAVREIEVGGLDDGELEQVAEAFPQLRRLVNEPRAKELLRRPAVIDLFVRSGSEGLPLSDADAFDVVWSKLIRSDERTVRGLPDARDQVLRHLATQQLRQTDPVAMYASLDAAAVAGLQRDVVLRPPDRWQPLPTFAHELLRTYAIARVLLAIGDPVAELIARNAPRWALPAARLALQVLLSAPDGPQSPLAGRFGSLQAAVDRLVEAGHGDRWGDLPTEAVLPLPTTARILAEAWPTLVSEGAVGLRRLLRVIKQRHRRAAMVDRLVAEPVVALLLHRGWPSELQDQVNEILSDWLRGLLLADQPAGHPLRIALRAQLAARVTVGDERMADLRREQAERLAARTPEEVAEDEDQARRWRALSAAADSGRRRRRRRELPGELIDDDLLEQLALLGPDLGDEGEALLRRVAADAPEHLDPAVEGLLTGQALARYDTKLLTHLVEAYYIDDRDDDDGYGGLRDDGVRDHRHLGLGRSLSAAYRGPFLALFRADLRAGIACLNRLLNHAARSRAQILRHLGWGQPPEPEDRYVQELDITGDRRKFVGDGHVWMWYRGTGVGPYPCMSALQALELVCDEYIKADVPLGALVQLLLDGCENLAMPALAVGMLARHLEHVEGELDPFLAEPAIWHLEFSRVISEHSGLAARSEEIAAPERRSWSLREVSVRLALNAVGDRIETLRSVGRRLVARAMELQGEANDGEPLTDEIAAVRGWAANLDRDNYEFTETEQGFLVEQIVDEDVVAKLAPSNADLARGSEATRLLFRYPERFDRFTDRPTVTREDLLADLGTARDLADQPPAAVPGRPYDAPAAVAAAALEARFRDGLDVPDEDLVWAARLLVGLLNALADQGVSEDEYSVFVHGADRAAARVLPLLWLPAARQLRELLAIQGIEAAALTRAVKWIVGNGANETRLFLARSCDPLWATSCEATASRCHHVDALTVIEDIARDSFIGPWNPAQQRNSRLHIGGPVAPALQRADHDLVDVPRLSATIRGSAAAATSSSCCNTDAAALLTAALAAHRRGMQNSEYGYQHSDNDALVGARAVLDLAASGDTSLLFEHINDYADDPRLLSEFLHALNAAGEETQHRATSATAVWPAVLDHIIELVASGTCRTDDRHYGQSPLEAAIPTPSNDWGYLHREYEADPILWADPVSLAPQIERWLPLAAGHREPLDALAHLLSKLPTGQQAEIGLPWMEQLVMANPSRIASRSFLLPEWLERIRPYAASQPLLGTWHRIVDALTVSGDDRIARLAD